MILRIDADSPMPPYEQLRSQLAAQVADGSLPTGTRLPAIRALAGDLGLAPGTVARAYRELEEDGVVATRGRHGTYVTGRQRAATSAAAAVREAAHEYVGRARAAGVSASDAIEAVRRAFLMTGS